jgi:hypothetical protein
VQTQRVVSHAVVAARPGALAVRRELLRLRGLPEIAGPSGRPADAASGRERAPARCSELDVQLEDAAQDGRIDAADPLELLAAGAAPSSAGRRSRP